MKKKVLSPFFTSQMYFEDSPTLMNYLWHLHGYICRNVCGYACVYLSLSVLKHKKYLIPENGKLSTS